MAASTSSRRTARTASKTATGDAAASQKLTVSRQFTHSGPFDGITFTTRQSRIGNPDGTSVFEMPDVEVPDTWDQVAVDILASKYFRKAGVPQTDADGNPIVDADGNPVLGPERSIKQVALRMANAWMMWGQRGGYFASDDDAIAFRDEMAYMVATQKAAPNSPQWFNTGLFEAYQISEDPEGNWYFDETLGEPVESAHKYERSAASACYILHVDDQLVGEQSIMRHIEDSARLFKAGSGVGANYSTIREKGGKLTGGGSSSGLMSFLRVHDRAAGAIKSGGTTRRAAKMVIVDADHPDIEEFIWCKVLEERKVAALVAAGYPSDYNGEAYDTVSFQNANHSVRLPAGFIEAVAGDADWDLVSRNSGNVVSTVKARELWDKIAVAAWSCADPGLQFDDIINDWNTVADTERLFGTNPCSEYTHIDNSACNLASLNLLGFWDDDTHSFDVDAYLHAVRLWTLTLEITVTMAHYPTAIVAKNSYEHRTLGLGYANMGALLMRAGLPYDSDAARAVMGAVTALLTDHSYTTSAEIAAAVGPCVAYAANESSTRRVLSNHRRAAYGSLAASSGLADYEHMHVRPQEIDHLTLAHTLFAALTPAVLRVADTMVEQVSRHGLRNQQATVLAPTGTIGLVMGCDTTGVEPDFALVKLKKLAGGGYMQIANGSVEPALRTLGYSDSDIASVLAHMRGTNTLHGDTAVSGVTLAAAGFSVEEINAADAALAAVSDLTWAFSSYTIGAAAYERFGVDPDGGGAALLAAAGFSFADVTASSKAICGHLTVEGAPALRPEHLPVFDCAVECGDGTRVIHWSGHVRALAAAQPHVSGAISKTINMPNDVTPDDVADAHEMAYRLGVKCVAIYRDGSKMSQPLNSAKSSEDGDETDETGAVVNVRDIVPGMSPAEYYHDQQPPRFRLPELRHGPRWRVEVGGEELYVGAGEYPDGTLGEVFIDWGKQGSTLRGITAALSITISQALQHGVPLARIVKALQGHTYEPRGMVVGHSNLKMATSVIDAVVRVLGYYYGGDPSLVQVPGGPTRADFGTVMSASDAAPAVSTVTEPRSATADTNTDTNTDTNAGATEVAGDAAGKSSGERVYGETCSACGSSHLLRAGSCKVCGSCGTTTGCS
jgi:ribonucleoside-diphosphate reductase alpha chain